jgi:hypothetical protein
MSATRSGALAVLTTLALLRPLSAQQAPLALGQRVRVVAAADNAAHEGHLVLVIRDTVALDNGHRVSDGVEYVALGSRGRLELPRHIRSHPLAGALVGAGTGMALGALSWSMNSMFTCLDACTPPAGQLIGRTGRVVLGGLVGAGLGLLVGAHVYTTLWDPVPPDQLDRLRVGIVPQPQGRLGLGASLGF